MENYWELKRTLLNVENQNLINAFLLSLKDENKAKRTVIDYRDRLQFFFKEREERFSSISWNDIKEWFTEQPKEWKERTIQDYIKALRSFYNYSKAKGYTDQSPIRDKRKACSTGVYWDLKQPMLDNENLNVIQAYLVYMKNAGKSKQKIVYDRTILQLFFKDWKKPFSSITSDEIQLWFTKQQRQWKTSTIQIYINVLRTFYSFCVQEGYMENPPLKKKRWVKVAEKYWEVQQPFRNQQNQIAMNEFLLHLKNANRAKKTIKETRMILQSFFRERNEHFSYIATKDINEWLDDYQKDRKGNTVVNRLSFLRSFYRYCVKQGHIEISPVQYKWERECRKGRYWELTEPLPNAENQDIINEFLASMKVANMSEGTIVRYRYFLWRFFSEKEEAFDHLTSDTILKWFIEQQNVLKESTFSSYLSILSSFYHFCVEEGNMVKSPIKSRWFPKVPKPVPKYLEKEEIAKVRLQCEKEAIRNRVIVEFLLVTGCRIGEVHRLSTEDVDLENRTARVLGKGRKIRTVHFTEKCALLLERYLGTRTDDSQALFVSQKEERLGLHSLQEVVKEIGRRARLSGSLHAHRLRHTFATELLAKGADLAFIADELGHSNLQTTQIYAQLPNRELISMYRKYMG